jgi:hypothetical protein
MKSFVYLVLFFAFTTFLIPQKSFASKIRGNFSSDNNQTCEMIENVQVYVNFNNQEHADPKTASDKMDQYIEDIANLAKQAGVTKLEIQSYNYSLNNNSGGCGSDSQQNYQFYGNINYSISPESAASTFMGLIEENNFKANLNVNAYRQCQ